MPTKTLELELIFRRERIRFDGGNVCILECQTPERPAGASGQPETGENGDGNDPFGSDIAPANLLAALMPRSETVTVKCEVPEDEPLVPSLSYRFYGSWNTHEKYGRQFAARTFVRCQPHSKAGVIRYLVTTCAGHGVGSATAHKLWQKFQGDAVRILREDPATAAAAVGMPHFTEEKAAAAAVVLKQESALEAVFIDLIDLLGGRGFPRDTAKNCVQEWGNKAAELVRRNPYLLMRFRGAGFGLTDKLYLDQGGNPAALKRQALCAWYGVARDTEGHTWYRPEFVEQALRGGIAGSELRLIDAMKLAKRARLLAVLRDEQGRPWVAEYKKAKNERDIAEHVGEILKEPCRWPEVAGLDISPHQFTEIEKALQTSIGILAGSPGTGKTYTLARLVGRIIERCGSESIAVAAPTGKAAVRITEALEGYGIQKAASTIHRLLGVSSRSFGEGWGFVHNENKPLLQQWIIVDEASMLDTDLMAALLRACGKGTHLLLVGDVNQLPPVGHGAPLRDLLAAGVPHGELTKIERNWGAIVQACADIRDSRRWRTVEELDPDAGQNLKLLPAANAAAAVEAIVGTIAKIRAGRLFDPVWDVQVIVAVNQKSELSRRELNKRLQGELNPDGARVGSNPFRVGDKIVCLKNAFMPVVADAPPDRNRDAVDGKVFVANGEQGRVVAVAEKLTTVSLEAPPRLIKIPRGAENGDKEENASQENASDGGDAKPSAGTGCQWDLAYGISCHKGQGSEFPVAIVALDEYPGARRVCSREWLYTAISRAKKICLLVGKRHTADGMCVQRAISKRKTFLKELITGAVP